MYILVSQTPLGTWMYCYSGKTYMIQGECFTSDVPKRDAKQYKSKKAAERAAIALGNKVGYIYVVEEIKD